MPIFSPPVEWESIPTHQRPFKFFKQPVSFAVVYRNSHFQSVRTPAREETDALIEGRTWFTGGRSYEVDDDTAALLIADGYTMTPPTGYGDSPYGTPFYGE